MQVVLTCNKDPYHLKCLVRGRTFAQDRAYASVFAE